MKKKLVKRKRATKTKEDSTDGKVEYDKDEILPLGAKNDKTKFWGRVKRDDNGRFVKGTKSQGRKHWYQDGNSRITISNLRKIYFQVFEVLGGVEEFAKWAAYSNSNQTEFYKLMSKMLPREVVFGDGKIEPNDLSQLEDKELDDIINRYPRNGQHTQKQGTRR